MLQMSMGDDNYFIRFVETSPSGSVCNPTAAPCIGGFARLATLIRDGLERNPESLVLNGGDSFQGTIWYNLLRWNVTQDFMNMVHHDAHVLGNHEFDNGIEGVVPYLQHLQSQVVTANIIDDDEPTLQGLYKPSIVVEKGGRKIGIIGVIISSTDELASTGNLKFTDEVEAVRREAEKLNEQGINIIVVLSHCGIDIDRKIALNAGPYIDIIVGGHSHTLLSNSDPPEGSTWTPLEPYPVVVEQATRSVLIVQAGAHTAFLGEIKLSFNDKGDLINWNGDPHYITNNVVQAPDVLDKINEYLPIINEQATELIGTSKIHLSSECNCGECNLGSFICDAFMHEVIMRSKRNKWNEAHLCVINSGGVRSDIEPGNVTFEKILLTTPFENNVEMFDLKGVYIKELLEYAAANEPYPGARMVQVSGMRIVFNGSQPLGSRVFEVFVRCIDCDIPQYYPLRLDTYYKVVSQDFIGNGGGGYTMMSNNRQNVEVLGVDYDLLSRYVRHQSPIMKDLDGRILIKDPCLEN
ncbi:apyrase-like [Danaus plexippus]|uniref:apyrase-like n=1 Tax=Danaus plexippus TaxID=13037 RepID=UPI002AAF274A|nr:apyrase-like [Danaus plexippus]